MRAERTLPSRAELDRRLASVKTNAAVSAVASVAAIVAEGGTATAATLQALDDRITVLEP